MFLKEADLMNVMNMILYRKRQRAEGYDEDVSMPHAKRLSSALKTSEAARESWESEVRDTFFY